MKTKKHKVSIVVPIYNVSGYIERCLRSICSQTFQGSMECILVDDCTPDDSIVKCENFLIGYKGSIDFIILHHEHNKGLSGARNTGTEYANGEYIFYLDSDDELTPDCIALMFSEVHKHPGIELVQGYTKCIPDTNYYHTERYKNLGYIDDNDWFRKECYKVDGSFPCNAWNKLIKTSILRENKLRFKEGIIHEDQHWIYFFSRYINSVTVLISPTYIHYVTSNSIMTSISTNNEKSTQSWAIILSDMLCNLDKKYLAEQLNLIITEFCIRNNVKTKEYEDLYRCLCRLIKKEYGIVALILFILYFKYAKIRGGWRLRVILSKLMNNRQNGV